MREKRFRGNVPHNQFMSDTLHDLLQEQRKTNSLLRIIVDEQEAEGTAEKLGKVLDGRKGKGKRK